MTEARHAVGLSHVSAVVCTKDAVSSIEECLTALRRAGVGEVIVVDATSTDGTREVADRLADVVLQDQGVGLGAARNLGIARTTGEFVLNVGADNVVGPDTISRMLTTLREGGYSGVGAMTRVAGDDYLSASMNAWWQTRFIAGPASVIGTPSLFRGSMLREHPYDPARRSSDDSELCDRWRRELGATFAISHAVVYETGKNSWAEVIRRAQLYGFSDFEVFTAGSREGWSPARKIQSLTHPLRKDLWEPLQRLPWTQRPTRAPFLTTFAALRYAAWAEAAVRSTDRRGSSR